MQIGVLKVNAVASDVAVFRYPAALEVELANVILVLSDSLLKVLGFADVHGWKICEWNPITDTLCSLSRRTIFW